MAGAGPRVRRTPDDEELLALAETLVDAVRTMPDDHVSPGPRWLPAPLLVVAVVLNRPFRAFLRGGAVAGREYERVFGVDRGEARAAVEMLRVQLVGLDDPADGQRVGVGALVAAARALLDVERDGDTEDAALARAVRAWDRLTDEVERHRRRRRRTEEGDVRLADATRRHREAWQAWFAAHGVDPAR